MSLIEVVGDQVVVRLRVGGRGLDQLADVLRGAARGEAEQRQRVLDAAGPGPGRRPAGALRGATRTKRALALTTGRSADAAAVFVAAFAAGFGFALAWGFGSAFGLASRLLRRRSFSRRPSSPRASSARLLVAVSFAVDPAAVFWPRFFAAGFLPRASSPGPSRFSSRQPSASPAPGQPAPEWARKVRWARTRPACGRPSTPRCRPARASAVVDGDRVPDHLREDRRWRDQVFSICFWPDSFIALTRFIRRSSAHGPFLVERPIRCRGGFTSSFLGGGRARSGRPSACPSYVSCSRASACPTE